jgi:hypothetical protein
VRASSAYPLMSKQRISSEAAAGHTRPDVNCDRLPIFGTTTLESVGIAVGEIAAMSELGVK